ncbi:hypothetical protein U1Q18_006286 [Sarracenia purpurea var. burkii]
MRITENSVITVSLNGVPRLENPNFVREEQNERDVTVIREDEEQNGNPVPKSVSNLVVYIVDSHVEHIEDIVSKLEIEFNVMELKMDEELIGRLTRQKKHVESFANRVTGMLVDLNSTEAEKLNREFYYVSLVTVICLPLSIIAGV